MRSSANEHGLALVLAIVALVVIGALVTAAFGPILLEQRIGENTRRTGQAFGTAEFAVSEAVANWNTATWNQLGIGDSTVITGTLPTGVGNYDGTVRRLNNELFLLEVTGTDAHSGARQRLGQFVKLQLLDLDVQAALTTRGPTNIGGSAEIDGNDVNPGGWGACGLPDTTKAGLRLPSTDDLTTVGANCSNAACVDGNPPVEADSTISDATFFQYGDLDWGDLTGMASLVIPPATYKIEPSVSNGQCNTSLLTNWGDPTNQVSSCFNHFPIVYSPGDLTINQSVGQGILLVEGDLSVQGGFEYYGVVIVKGQLKTTGTGGHFNGAVLAANVDLDDITLFGDALVQYSSCAVRRALLQASPGAPLSSRGWLYAY